MTTNTEFGIFDGPIPCQLRGWTYGALNAWAYPGKCSTDAWIVESVCKQVSIRVFAGYACSKVQCEGLPVFYYD
jgi:hypothetical protein